MTAAIKKLQEEVEKLKKQKPAPPVPGEKGAKGDAGPKGADGRGIRSAALEGGNLVFEFTDGTRTVVGRVVGADGKPGVVTVEFVENGKTLTRVSDVKSGSLVRQPIERFKTEN